VPAGDNQGTLPARLDGVEPPRHLENELRRSLGHQAAAVLPSGADLFGSALRRGRRRRRLRGGAGLVAVVAATVVASGLLLHSPAPAPVAGQLGFAYPQAVQLAHPPVTTTLHVVPELADHQWLSFGAPVGVVGYDDRDQLLLATGDGVVVNLRQLRQVSYVHPVGDDWMVVADGWRDTLWRVGDQATPQLVLGKLDALTVDRSRLAWRRGEMLSAARLSRIGELERQIDTPVPDGVDPVGFLEDAVLLRHRGQDGSPAGFGLWRPAFGAYQSAPATEVVRVYGARAGSDTAVGLVTIANQPCLAILNVEAGLAVETTACLPVLPGTGPAAVSPDGRWLLGTVAGEEVAGGAAVGEAVLVDLDAAFAGDPSASILLEGIAGPRLAPLWSNSGAAVFVSEGKAVRVQPDRLISGGSRPVERVAVPGEPVVALFPLT
jgi:hypothetical protein